MGLRWKILSGFLILALMLLLAGGWSIHQMSALGFSVQRILDENYKSIVAAKSMSEALEREDSGVLLLLLGKWEEGRSILESADAAFEEEFSLAEGNLTIPGEGEHLAAIRSAYTEYRETWIRPIVGTPKERDLNWYSSEVHPAFLRAKDAVRELLALNDREMYQTASSLEDRANRAVMPGVVAIVSALVFSLVFSYFVNVYMVGPLIRITGGIREFTERDVPFDVRVETRDELGGLASAIHELCARVRSFEGRK
jgi:HAMP domain-containing protein